MQTLKFITLNILEGGVFFDKILSFLEKEQPDIVVMQEVCDGRDPRSPQNHRSLEEFKKFFKNYYFHFAPVFKFDKYSEIEKIEFGNAIFSRFPITNSNVVFIDIPYNPSYATPFKSYDYSNDPVNIQHVEIKFGEIILNIFNVHGVWGLDGVDNDRRLRMSNKIVEQIQGKENVILAGDFNVKPDTTSIRNIEKHLVNVFKNELKSTFNMRHKDLLGYSKSVVDMVFVSPNLKVLEHSCPDADVSDHYPLVCEFEI